MNIDGITSASINVSMYLFIIIDDNDVYVDDAGLAIFWILSPMINDDVPINNETTVRIFCVIPGISVSEVLSYCGVSSANTYEVDEL